MHGHWQFRSENSPYSVLQAGMKLLPIVHSLFGSGRQVRHKFGQGMVEVSLIIAVIAIVAIVTITTLGGRTTQVFSNIITGFSGSTSTPSPSPTPALVAYIKTFAGNGTGAYAGDGGAATSAEINTPKGVAVDAAGNLYIADANDNRIRKVDASTGIITTVAG